MNETDTINLAHGNGGRFMRELIDEIFKPLLNESQLDTTVDAASLNLASQDIMFTTDGFTVKPLEFPGGSIGSLAVHGTVNDLAVSGATPRYLSVNAFIEEGMPVSQLKRIISDMAQAAREAQVHIVAGDTKVVPRGEGSGVYFATSGIGVKATRLALGMQQIRPGDRLLISGSIGDHGTAVMLAREQFGLSGELQSDATTVTPLTQALLDLPGLRFMRDPTRGGMATVCTEICHATRLGIHLEETAIPVKPQVEAICEMLGYDPFYLACEGRVLAVVAECDVSIALQRWQALNCGTQAAIIGTVTQTNRVVLETRLGGQRILEELEDDPLPRIC